VVDVLLIVASIIVDDVITVVDTEEDVVSGSKDALVILAVGEKPEYNPNATKPEKTHINKINKVFIPPTPLYKI